MTMDEVIAEGERQSNSQDGSHVTLDGYEWGVLRAGIEHLKAKAAGLQEIIDRYEEIKAAVGAQVIAGDVIRKASGT